MYGNYKGKIDKVNSLYNSFSDRTTFWSKAPQAKLFTAKEKYKNEDWFNKDIHDTHLKSTDNDYYYPDDLNFTEEHLFIQSDLIFPTISILRYRASLIRDFGSPVFLEKFNKLCLIG